MAVNSCAYFDEGSPHLLSLAFQSFGKRAILKGPKTNEDPFFQTL